MLTPTQLTMTRVTLIMPAILTTVTTAILTITAIPTIMATRTTLVTIVAIRGGLTVLSIIGRHFILHSAAFIISTTTLAMMDIFMATTGILMAAGSTQPAQDALELTLSQRSLSVQRRPAFVQCPWAAAPLGAASQCLHAASL